MLFLFANSAFVVTFSVTVGAIFGFGLGKLRVLSILHAQEQDLQMDLEKAIVEERRAMIAQLDKALIVCADCLPARIKDIQADLLKDIPKTQEECEY